ncbi:MAG: hypothetical protein FWD80_07630, partial [Propionibacteriaceae bacterium]|nr:hypothetical protein [Propionibacteriaceae bacterium]
MTDWHKLSHAYGKATDTPGLLNQLRGADWQQATNDLYASILHQGTIYTATLPAIAELTAIVLDLTAPGRVGAANLIADYADSVKVGWAHNPNYLPKKLNLDEFEASACAALGEAVAALTPCLADGDSDIRQCVALTCERTVNLPSVTIDALHKRLADETVASVIMALVAAIQAHGGLTDAETANLQHAAPEVRFAQAATALVNGLLGDDTIATAAELWSNCVA